MKKLNLVFLTLFLIVVPSGCQTLGDRLQSKYSVNGPLTSAEVAVNTPEATGPELTIQNEPAAVAGAVKTVGGGESGQVGETEYNNIFFASTRYDPQNKNCNLVSWVSLPGGDLGASAVERNLGLLLAGPGDKWAAEGYYSSVPVGTKLLGIRTEGDTLYLSFSGELKLIADTCQAKRARQQIELTAKYAVDGTGETIKQVEITSGGERW
ncbi:MAG: GerMN domain-containing protein [Patescibacteria group bacterium]|jgi:hypothetical protein